MDGVESEELEVEQVTWRCSREMDAALTTVVSRLHQGWQYKLLKMMKHELNEKDTNTIFPGCLSIWQFPHPPLITEIENSGS